MNIHVGNLSPEVTNDDLRTFFGALGNVENAEVILDIHTGKSVGYGFVIMTSEEEAVNAINTLNGKPWMGKNLTVAKAKHQKWLPKRQHRPPEQNDQSRRPSRRF